MTRIASGLTVALALLVPTTAAANFRFVRPAEVRTYYYAPATVYYWCPAPVVPLMPAPVAAAGRLYATPTPAPASPLREPPLAPPMPGVSESRFSDGLKASASFQPGVAETRFYDAFPAEGGRGSGDSSSCSVAFWNLTGRELVLKIDGQRRVLSAGKNVSFDLGRQFVWQVEGREAQLEKVPAGESGLEIVIRR